MPRSSLTPSDLLLGYRSGLFPMADPDNADTIEWYDPALRGIIPLDTFSPPRNLLRLYRSGRFTYGMSLHFEEVMTHCANRDKTWISKEIIELYTALHRQGHAHSFETLLDGKLVGGLYGVSLGKAFFGESMFHTVTNASKLALVYLVQYLRQHSFSLLDTQYLTPHLASLGGIEIKRSEYLKLLKEAVGDS